MKKTTKEYVYTNMENGIKFMYVLIPTIFFLFSGVLFSKDFSGGLEKILQKNPHQDINLAKTADDADYESEDESDDEEFSANTIQSKNTRTKSSNRPKTPSSQNEWKLVISPEIDPEKKKLMVKEGLSIIHTYQEKNNSSSVKQISRILLSNPLPEVRTEAARALGKLGKGIKSLHKAIDTDGYEVRQEAYKSIERIGSRLSLKYFIAGIKSTDHGIRISSFKGLGKTKSSLGRDLILKQGVTAEEPEVVHSALTGLGYFSRKEDLDIFKKFLKSEVTLHQTGAIQGLGNSSLSGTIDLLLTALEETPNLEPEIIHAFTQKKSLAGTLVLIKILHSSKNENFQMMIQKELYNRKAFGKYAIVTTNTASLRKQSRANSSKVTVLKKGDVARIRKVTEKLFKAKMNKEVIEDRYYLLQAVSDRDSNRKQLLEGWVFGPKINIISLTKPGKPIQVSKSSNLNLADETEDFVEEDSEDEKANTTVAVPVKEPENPSAKSVEPTKTEPEFYDEDEDE